MKPTLCVSGKTFFDLLPNERYNKRINFITSDVDYQLVEFTFCLMSQLIPSVTTSPPPPPSRATGQTLKSSRDQSNPVTQAKFYGQIPFPRVNSVGQFPGGRAKFQPLLPPNLKQSPDIEIS